MHPASAVISLVLLPIPGLPFPEAPCEGYTHSQRLARILMCCFVCALVFVDYWPSGGKNCSCLPVPLPFLLQKENLSSYCCNRRQPTRPKQQEVQSDRLGPSRPPLQSLQAFPLSLPVFYAPLQSAELGLERGARRRCCGVSVEGGNALASAVFAGARRGGGRARSGRAQVGRKQGDQGGRNGWRRTYRVVLEHAHGRRRAGARELVEEARHGHREEPHRDDTGFHCSRQKRSKVSIWARLRDGGGLGLGGGVALRTFLGHG